MAGSAADAPAPNAIVALREITNDNLRPVMRLNVKPDQEGFVAPNAFSIAEHAYAPDAGLRAIYADDDPVGLVLLKEDRETPRYYLWRFMIDASQQGKGYGYAAMELLIDYVKGLPGATELFLSYVPGEGSPEGFYARLGFVDTGRVEDGENEAVLRLS